MLKTEFDDTTASQTESAQETAELNEGDLNEVAGGLNFTRRPPPEAVDMF